MDALHDGVRETPAVSQDIMADAMGYSQQVQGKFPSQRYSPSQGPRDTAPEETILRQRLLAHLAEKIGPERFEIWFGNSARLAIAADGSVEIAVPNSFIARYLQETYLGEIRAAAAVTLGREAPAVRFAIGQAAVGALMGRAPSLAELGSEPSAEDSRIVPLGGGPAAITPAATGGVSSLGGGRAAAAGPLPPTRTASHWLPDGLPQGPRRFTLAEFVVGPSNRLAHAAAAQVADRPGTAFNPLFVHGACGLGKTHLLLGVAGAISAQRPDWAVCYVSAEEFTNQYIAAMRAGQLDGFRREVRTQDVLVLDDVHFLAGKDRTQEEFLNSFKTLETAGRQVVLASDRPPSELAEFSAHLVSRFVAGMVVAVERPDRATRRAILAGRAARQTVGVARGHTPGHATGGGAAWLSEAVLDYLADTITGNVRDLEGALNKLSAGAMVNGGVVDLALACELLPHHAPGTAGASGSPSSGGSPTSPARPVPPVVVRLEAAIAETFAVAVADLAGTRRSNGLNLARQMLMYLLRDQAHWTYQQIADHLDRRNHSTVVVACRKMQEMLDAQTPVAMAGYDPGNYPTARQVLSRVIEAARRRS